MSYSTVITYSAPSGERITLTPAQVEALKRIGRWPKTHRGAEYCQVSHGRHAGHATWSNAELAAEVGVDRLA